MTQELTSEEVRNLIAQMSSPDSPGIIHQIVSAGSRRDIAVVRRHTGKRSNGRDTFYLVWKQPSGRILNEELLAAPCVMPPCSNGSFFGVEDDVLVVEISLVLPRMGFQKQVLRAPLKRLGLD